MNYCISAAWHGGDQPAAQLRRNGSPGCFNSDLQVICFVGSGPAHVPLDSPEVLCGLHVRHVCWSVTHSNTTGTEPAV